MVSEVFRSCAGELNVESEEPAPVKTAGGLLAMDGNRVLLEGGVCDDKSRSSGGPKVPRWRPVVAEGGKGRSVG